MISLIYNRAKIKINTKKIIIDLTVRRGLRCQVQDSNLEPLRMGRVMDQKNNNNQAPSASISVTQKLYPKLLVHFEAI